MLIDLLGKEWDVVSLEREMIDDEFYYGYMAKASLSSSACKDLYSNPKDYGTGLLKQRGDSDAFMQGRLIHQTILEPEKHFEYNVIDAKDKRAKEWKDAVKKNKPNTILKRDYDKCKRLCQTLLDNSSAKSLLEDCETEKPRAGYIGGFLFRAKADAISVFGDSLIDLKTTSDISKFKWSARTYGYDMQCFIYCELFGIDYSQYKFLAVDKTNEIAGIFEVSEQFYKEGERKVMKAIDNYIKYYKENTEDLKDYTIKDIL